MLAQDISKVIYNPLIEQMQMQNHQTGFDLGLYTHLRRAG